MKSQGGAATQVCSPQFDRRFFALPAATQQKIQSKVDELGRNLRVFPHHRMQGVDAYRLRVGDYRVIYQIDMEKNELFLIAVGNRREIYKKPVN